MRVRILGSAAGGGFPQWNCACHNCARFRAGSFAGKARTQSQVALSLDHHNWYLLNASPDLRVQIEATPELHPRNGLRHTPIGAIVLTSAELDHILGLLHLREFQPLRIFATPSVRRILTEDNSIFGVLQRTSDQAVWTDIRAGEAFELGPVSGPPSGILSIPFAVPGDFPVYVRGKRRAEFPAGEAVLGVSVEVEAGGKRVIFIPGLPRIDSSLLERLNACDLLLLDGTFWADDEPQRVYGGARTARQMGHLPISGPEGSLARMSELAGPRKIFIHINNTNPILDEESNEHRRVLDAGWEVAEDGWDFQI